MATIQLKGYLWLEKQEKSQRCTYRIKANTYLLPLTSVFHFLGPRFHFSHDWGF